MDGGHIEPAAQRPYLEIYAELKSLRLAQGLSQRQVAVLVGCSRTCIVNWERGVSHPTFPWFMRWAGVFGLSVNIK
jgi:transcriptional regulator with XRE-family HTH domain